MPGVSDRKPKNRDWFQAGIEKPRGMSRIEVVEAQSVITNEV
jgi:hypothetical protein